MRAQAAVLLLLGSALARAADPTPAPADSIAAAKSDLATIKTLGTPLEGASSLPTMDMKDISPGPGPGRADVPVVIAPDDESSLDPTKKKAKEGTGNWLVDAMDKKADKGRSSTRLDDLAKSDRDLLRDGDAATALGDKDGAASADAKDRADPKADAKEAPVSTYNPLASFMSGWISSRDHDLLLPAKTEGPAGGEAARARSDELPDVDLGQPAGVTESALPPVDASWGDSKGPANPYLVSLDLDPITSVKPFAPQDAGGFAPAALTELPGAAAIDPRPPDAGRTFVPDFAQPSDDDKYFKQLKKF